MTDFTKKDQNFYYKAVGQNINEHKILNTDASTVFNNLYKEISRQHSQNETNKSRLISFHGCIERLRSCLLYSKRLSKHHIDICNQKMPEPGGLIAYDWNTARFDFESFIFHSRALLDRLTFLICKQIYNQDCDKFNKIIKCLKNSVKSDKKVERTLEIIEQCFDSFEGLLFDKNNEKSLRSSLIHKSTISENTICAFTFHCLSNSEIIRFDYEIKEYPLFGSTWNITKYISFLTLNLLGIYLDISDTVSFDQCNPLWENKFIHFSKYIKNDENSINLSIVKMNPSGFEIQTEKLDKSVLNISDS